MSGKFEVLKITSFNDILDGTIKELPESDLCFQNEDGIAQFKFVRDVDSEKAKMIVSPGVYTLAHTQVGIVPQATELRVQDLLGDIISSKKITDEAKTFFSKLHIYDQLNRPKKRGVLLYSDPGMGKSSSIADFITKSVAEDPGTVAIIWPTSKLDADDVSHFLSIKSEFSEECTRLIFVMEDIGGNEHEGNGGSRGVDSGLLNLLDGLEVTFKLPTFIMATTNYPQNLLKELADRPRRFDLLIKLDPPSSKERVKLAAFIAKRDLSSEEISAFMHKRCNKFSIAHIEEVIIRSLLHDKSIGDVIEEIVTHKERFAKEFAELKEDSGFGF